MNRRAFIKTVIEVLKYHRSFNELNGREQLIRMLSRAEINYVEQYSFVRGGKPYQKWEVIELRFPVPLLDEANDKCEELNKLVRYVYEESDEYALQEVKIRPIVTDTPSEVTEYDVVFDKIQNTVIHGIRNAKFLVWAAVAWFSNEAIFNELLSKKNQGLNVRIIVSDEESNSPMITKLKSYGFDVKVIKRWGYNDYNRMHDKFCIIDMDYVMHGSYNWTPTANNNDETLATALDHEFVSKFAQEFMSLYTE